MSQAKCLSCFPSPSSALAVQNRSTISAVHNLRRAARAAPCLLQPRVLIDHGPVTIRATTRPAREDPAPFALFDVTCRLMSLVHGTVLLWNGYMPASSASATSVARMAPSAARDSSMPRTTPRRALRLAATVGQPILFLFLAQRRKCDQCEQKAEVRTEGGEDEHCV